MCGAHVCVFLLLFFFGYCFFFFHGVSFLCVLTCGGEGRARGCIGWVYVSVWYTNKMNSSSFPPILSISFSLLCPLEKTKTTTSTPNKTHNRPHFLESFHRFISSHPLSVNLIFSRHLVCPATSLTPSTVCVLVHVYTAAPSPSLPLLSLLLLLLLIFCLRFGLDLVNKSHMSDRNIICVNFGFWILTSSCIYKN